MAISLQNLFHYGNMVRAGENMDAAATADAVSFSHAGRNHITSETLDLSKLMPGDMLRGTIVSIDEEGISLLLSEGQTIKASVQDQMNMTVGQKMIFSVFLI